MCFLGGLLTSCTTIYDSDYYSKNTSFIIIFKKLKRHFRSSVNTTILLEEYLYDLNQEISKVILLQSANLAQKVVHRFE